jgi:uncharacterized HhH-GPD family protein
MFMVGRAWREHTVETVLDRARSLDAARSVAHLPETPRTVWRYAAAMATKRVTSLPFTGDDDADRLLASEPMALLIGFVLDQQVSVQKAFSGPLELQRRIGTLEPAVIAAMDPGDLESVFRERPAIHRFPGNMARRVQACCRAVVEEYGGRPERVWTGAADAADLEVRLLALPGIGAMKAKALLAILARRFGVVLAGMEAVMPHYPTLADVDSPEALTAYQENKRAYKASLKAGGDTFDPTEAGRGDHG